VKFILKQVAIAVITFLGIFLFFLQIPTVSASNISLDLIHPLNDTNVTHNEWFKVIVNVSCKGPSNCGMINVSLDPTIRRINLTENNDTADVKYGTAGTGGNGGGQIRWELPTEIHHKNILNATMCFFNRDSETTEFVKQIWLINQSDHWDESSNAATLNSQQKIIAVNTTSTCGTSSCWSCHNVTALVQKAADLGYVNATFRIESATLPIGTNINSVTNLDGLEPGNYWVFDDREHTQSLGGPALTIDYGPSKGLISTIKGRSPFWTNESNPRQVNLSANQSQIITFWVNATTQSGTYEFFVYANRTAKMNDSNSTRKWNVTVFYDFGLLVSLLSPADNTNNADLNNITLICNASTYAGRLMNMTLYDSSSGWSSKETKGMHGKTNTRNFTRDYEQNNTFLDAGIAWNCFAQNNRSNSAFAPSNRTFSNWDLGTKNGIEIQNGQLITTGNLFTNIVERVMNPNSTDTNMDVYYNNATQKIFYAWAEDDGIGTNQIWTAQLNSDNTGWSSSKRTNATYNRIEPAIQVYNNKVYVIYRGRDAQQNTDQLWLGTMNTSGGNWTEQQLTNYTQDNIFLPAMAIDDRTNTIYITYIKDNDLWLGEYDINSKTFKGSAINNSNDFVAAHIFLDKTTNSLYFITDHAGGGRTNVSHIRTNLTGGNYTETYFPGLSGSMMTRGVSDAVYDPVSNNFYYATSIVNTVWNTYRGVCNKDCSNSTWILTNSSNSSHSLWPRLQNIDGYIAMSWLYTETLAAPFQINFVAGKFNANNNFTQASRLIKKTNSSINAPLYYDSTYDPESNKIRLLFPRYDNQASSIQGIYTADWSITDYGTYISRVMNANMPANWLNITYTSTSPPEINITFEYRVSQDSVNWSNWTAKNNLPALNSQYFQYRVIFNGSNTSQSATLEQVQINYSTEPHPTVTLNYPLNRNWSISMTNVTFNCSATTQNGSYLTNISLYSDFNGTWQLIETQNIGGRQGTGIFNYNLTEPYNYRDAGVRWNCVAYNNYSNSDWGNNDYYFASWNRGTHNNTKISNTGVLQLNQTSQTVQEWNDITQGNVPPLTLKGALIYDPITYEAVYFGGQNMTVGATNLYPNITWTYDYYTKTWTDVTAMLTNAPDFAEQLPTAGYDSSLKLIVTYARKRSTNQDAVWFYNNSNKVWTYTNVTSPPNMVTRRAALYDNTDNVFVVLANMSDGNEYIFFYNHTSDTWTNKSFGTNGPVGREVMASAYDPDNEIYLFFGGSNSDSPPWTEFNETWIYNKSAQTLINITGLSRAPAPRTYMDTPVYDPQKKAIVFFGGAVYDNSTANVNTHNDTWYFNSSSLTWTEQSLVTRPPGTGGGVMEYIPHPDRDIIIIVDGFVRYDSITQAVTELNSTWELVSYKNYTERKTTFSQQVNVTNGTELGYMNDWTAHLTGTGNIIIQGSAGMNWPGVARFNTTNESTDAAALSNTNPLPANYIISTAAATDTVTGVANPGLVTIGILKKGMPILANNTKVINSFKLAIVPLNLGPLSGTLFEYQNSTGGVKYWDGANDVWTAAAATAAPFTYGAWYGHEVRKTSSHYIFLIRNLTSGKMIEMATIPVSLVVNGTDEDTAIIGDFITDWESGTMRIDNLTIKTEQSEGAYTSEAIDSGQSSDWNYFAWTSSALNGTNVSMLGRTSDDGIIWSNWSTMNTNPSTNIAAAQQYFQYKTELETEGSAAPSLSDVLVNYTTTKNRIRVTLLLNLMTQANSTKTISIYRSRTGSRVALNNTNSSNITYLLTPGTYDLQIECDTLDSKIRFDNLSLSKNNTYRVSLDATGASGKMLRIFAAETDLNITTAVVTVSYQGTHYTNENKLYINKCNNWNMTAKTCNSAWQKQQTAINKTAKTLSCTVNSLSGFGVAQGAASGSAGGGGGGSSSRNAYDDTTPQDELQIEPMQVPEKFKDLLLNEEQKYESITETIKKEIKNRKLQEAPTGIISMPEPIKPRKTLPYIAIILLVVLVVGIGYALHKH